jgi:ABC-type oligopeptide transport system substrate-binding subunit
VRTVDEAQFINRERNWDFDSITQVWGQSLSPGNEQRDFWGSQAADQRLAQLAGIKDAAIDALIERVIFAKDRAELVAATKALDRVLLWNHYVVPQLTYNKQRAARWDRFGRPEKLPEYGSSAFPTIWWWDAERAAKTGSRYDSHARGHRIPVVIIGAGALAGGFPGAANATDEKETHGISSFGDLKYPADFRQLEYVNVNAPKGGLFSQIGPSRQYNQNFLTFNSLNSYILRGDGRAGDAAHLRVADAGCR